MPKYFWLFDQHNEELMKNHNEEFSFIQVRDTFIHLLFFCELIVLEMSPERFRLSSVVWQTALTLTNLNLDICSLIVPAPEMNYRPFCHSGERQDQTGQTRHVAALGMSGQRHHTVTLRDFRYSQYNPDVSWVTVKWEVQLMRQISPFLIRERQIHKSQCDCQSELIERRFWKYT